MKLLDLHRLKATQQTRHEHPVTRDRRVTVSPDPWSSAGGLPESVISTLCSLANRPGGGLIILGLDEAAGFTPVGLTKPREMKSALAAKARAAFDPPIAIHLDHAVVDGEAVIVGIVDELDSSQKPCRVSGGQHKGVWIRAWDGDYRANALASAGLPKPLFYDDALRFTVVLRQRSNNGRSTTQPNTSRAKILLALNSGPLDVR